MRNKVIKRMLGDPRSSTFQRATRSLILEELDLKTLWKLVATRGLVDVECTPLVEQISEVALSLRTRCRERNVKKKLLVRFGFEK